MLNPRGHLAFVVLGCSVFCGCDHTETFEGLTVEHVDEPVLLRHNFAPGDKWTMHIESEIGGGPGETIILNGLARIECVSRSQDRARYRATFEMDGSGEGSFGEAAQKLEEGTKGFVLESLKDLCGNVISETVNGVPIPAEDGADASDLILPEAPVRSGDTWQSQIKSGPLVAKITYRFVGRVVYEGEPAYAIAGSFNRGEKLQDDPGYNYIVEATTLRTLRVTGGFKSTDGIVGKFDVRSID